MDMEEIKKEDASLAWTPVRTEHLVTDQWIDFRKVTYRFPDGSEFGPYYNYSRRNYVVIVASDEEGRFLCVRQYRHGIRQVTTEFPAGGIETAENAPDWDPMGQQAGETALAAAKRELLEETGYTSDEWAHLITVPSAATIADNYAFIFRAKNCRKTGTQHLDDTEFLVRKLLTGEEINRLIDRGAFQQAMHCMAWFLTGRGEA